MYFILTHDIQYEFHIRTPQIIFDGFSFMDGLRLPDRLTEEPFRYTTEAKAGDQLPDFCDSNIPVISNHLLSLLKGAGVDSIQTYRAEVVSLSDGTVWGNYSALNVTEMISCADLSRSKYRELFPGHYEFDSLAVDVSKTGGSLLFRLEESPGVILIHKSVGKYIGEHDPSKTLRGIHPKKVLCDF